MQSSTACQFADKSRNIRVTDLAVLPPDDATFEPTQAPPSWEEKKQEKRKEGRATSMAERGVHDGARVCLASDSSRRGVVESQGDGGHLAVRFADTSRNVHIRDLVVLPSDDLTFEPSQAPPSCVEKRQEEQASNMAARGLHAGARVCLVSDSAWRGVVESQGVGPYWAVRFADKSHNIRVKDLEVLPSDDPTFEPSQAPPSAREKEQEERATSMAKRGVYVGAHVCLVSDSARRGVVESQVARGCWAVRFADKSRNICVNDLEVLPSEDLTFEPSRAPPSSRERQQETRAKTRAVDRALERATPPAAASSRKRRAETSDDDAGAAAAAEASDDGEETGDGASGDEPRAKRQKGLNGEALESVPLLSSLDAHREIARLRALIVAVTEDRDAVTEDRNYAHREIARLWALVGGAPIETIDVDADGALESAAEAAAQRRANTAAPASNLAALALLHASHETIVVAIKEERDTVAEDRDKVTEDRDDHEDGCNTAYKFIEQQKDVIGGLKDEIVGLRREIDGLQREAQRRDAGLEAAAIEAAPQPPKRRARPR